MVNPLLILHLLSSATACQGAHTSQFVTEVGHVLQVLDLLMTEAENHRGRLVVVLAGDQKPMGELMAYNEGLPSGFPTTVFNFPDYTDEDGAAGDVHGHPEQ